MIYASTGAFRQALEDRLRAQSNTSGMPLGRLRKMIAFERFLARLITDQPNDWILKGGLALQYRVADRARTTKDVDLLSTRNLSRTSAHEALVRAGLLNLNDGFQFEVEAPIPGGELRFRTRALLDARLFEEFHVDVGSGDPVVELPDKLSTPAFLQFAGIPSIVIPCYPLTQQIAEKVHAYTRAYGRQNSSRVKDWVDILLMAELGRIDGRTLAHALDETFKTRATHSRPARLPDPPSDWVLEFRKMAREVRLGYPSMAEATVAISRFLDPVLQKENCGVWNPAIWSWD